MLAGFRFRPSRALRLALALGAILGLAWLAAVARVLTWRPPALAAPPGDGLERVRLAVHVHSRVADGTGEVPEIARAARAAGLDALWVTDHDSHAALGSAGWHDGVRVLVGVERDTDGGHLLCLGLGQPPFPIAREAAEAGRDARAAGMVAIVAHPFRRGQPSLRWTGPLDGVDGVEVINLDAALRDGGPRGWLAAPLLWLRPELTLAAIAGPEREARALWDRLLETRLAVAVAAADAHGTGPGYRAPLAAVVNIVLLEGPWPRGSGAAEPVAEAVARGRVLVAWSAIADPGQASFVARRGEDRWLPGDVAPAGGPLDLELVSGLDRDADLRIVHRGQVVAEGRGRSLRHQASAPGAWRGEIDLPGAPHAPWLLTNAIGLAGPGWPVWPAAPPEPAPAGPAPPGAQSLLTSLSAESDSLSQVELTRAGDVLRFRWSLGNPDAGGHELWAAAVDRSGPRSLAGHRALVIAGSARAPVRLDVGFTLPDGRRAVRQVRFEPTARTFRFPLDSFPGAALGARAENLLITADRGNAWPGSSGELELEEFRLE